MKRTLTLIAAALLWCGASQVLAQADATFRFVDADGNEVPDGTVLTVSQLNESGQMVVPLRVQNVSGQKAAASIYETIADKPNGEWQTCAFGNCLTLSKNGYSPKSVAEAGYDRSIQTEWIPTPGAYAEWTATLQIHVFNIVTKTQFGQKIDSAGDDIIGHGPTVTVRFLYQDPSHVGSLLTDGTAISHIYSFDGRQLNALRRGLNIVRLSDGRVQKFFKH